MVTTETCAFHRRTRMLWRCAFAAAVVPLAAPGPPPAGPSISDVLATLKAEAQTVLDTGDMGEKPDFASRTDGRPSDRAVQAALVQIADDHPFIDAYIRWQLTSFDVALSHRPSDFADLLRNAPAMTFNPRADETAIDLLTRASEAGPLSEHDLTHLRTFERELDKRTAAAEAFNRPAVEFRDWVAEQLGDSGPKPLLWMIEECAATIDAGWSTRSVKGRMSRALSASVDDPAMTNADRRMIAEHVGRLAGRERKSVNLITYFADGTVGVNFSTARVTQRDVDRWHERLAGLDP